MNQFFRRFCWRRRASALVMAFLWLAASTASAEVNPGIPITNPDTVRINFVPVDNSSGGAALDGFLTTDIRLDFEGQYGGSQLIIELNSGSFYRDPRGNTDGNRPGFLDLAKYPSLAFDTAIYGGFPGGGAVDIGGGGQAEYPMNGGTSLNQAWVFLGEVIADRQDYHDIRLTMTEDASGTFKYLMIEGSAQGLGISFREGVISGGRLVPEPGSISFLIAAMIAVGLRSRSVLNS